MANNTNNGKVATAAPASNAAANRRTLNESMSVSPKRSLVIGRLQDSYRRVHKNDFALILRAKD